jgi:hypothetical protein
MNAQTAAVRLLAGDKEPVRLASTGNLALAGLLTVDSVVTAAGDRVLVKDQTSAIQNGIYTASAGTWKRAPDAASSRTLIAGMKVHVQEGTINAGAIWSLATNRPDVGDDDIDWEFYFSVGLVEELNNVANDIIATIYSLTGAADYASRSVAAAATLPVGMTFLRTAGYSAAGDGGGALYKKVVSEPSHTGKFQSVDGAWWELVYLGGHVTLGQFGAVGNGSTDDRAAIQSAIDTVSAAGGGRICGVFGRTYRMVIGPTDFDGVTLKPGVTLDLYGAAAINLECTGSVYGIRLQSNSHIVGPGLVKTTVSASSGSQGIWHAPIAVGAAYGEVTSVGAVGSYINASNWSIRNLTVENVRVGTGEIIGLCGGINHGLIEDVVISDNSTLSVAIGLDHGTVGNLSAADIPASRILFDAGQAYSVFPHDITIRRCKIGNMTKTKVGDDGGFGVRLSGCYKITIEDIEVESSSYCGFFHTAGDFGFEFAPSNELKRRRYRGTTFKNCHVYDALTGYGFLCEAYADNIAAAISGSGYVPLLAPINNTDILFEGCRSIASVAATAGPGFYISNMIGGTLRNCSTIFAQYGVQVVNGCDELLIDGGSFVSSYKDGIYVGDADAPEDVRIVGAVCYSSGQDPGGTLYAGIRFDAATRPVAERCVLGISAESAQDNGIRVTTSAVGAVLRGNNVLGVAASGVAYVLAGTNNYTCIGLFKDNDAASSITTKVSGVDIVPFDRVHVLGNTAPLRHWTTSRAGSSLTAGTTPAAGTWALGDRIFYCDPVASGFTGTCCVTAGSPGTWKRFGAVEA